MNGLNDQIARLQAAITRLETEVADQEADVLDLQRELSAFQARYDRLVKPLAERLELVQGLIKDLEDQSTPSSTAEWTPPQDYVPVAEQFRRTWQKPETESGLTETLKSDWSPPDDYISVEEQFRRTWRNPGSQPPPSSGTTPPAAKPATGPLSPKVLKQLYRQLARRYHPDLTTDPVERERRNKLMAEINAAYSQRDLAALQALAAQPDGATIEEPLAVLQLRQLQQIHDQLEQRLVYLKRERHAILHSDLMELKLQETLQNRNVLQDIADQLETAYRDSLRRLDELRGLR